MWNLKLDMKVNIDLERAQATEGHWNSDFISMGVNLPPQSAGVEQLCCPGGVHTEETRLSKSDEPHTGSLGRNVLSLSLWLAPFSPAE